MRNNYRSAYTYADKIKTETGINVFENKRLRGIVEYRSLLVKILRDVEGYKLYQIRDFFRLNGKKYDHSTALHSYKEYEIYKRYNKNLEQLFYILLTNKQGKKQKLKIIQEHLGKFTLKDLARIEKLLIKAIKNKENADSKS